MDINRWTDTCKPCIDPDSSQTRDQGTRSIPPFQTHSRYFYAPLGEVCCGRYFVLLFYQQYHPFPHCRSCAGSMIVAASDICWQCRTYFRRYSTGMMQQLMGVTLQRYSSLDVIFPDHGTNQRRLPEEQIAQDWREDTITVLGRPTQETSCIYWQNVRDILGRLGNNRCLLNLPTVPMPYYNEEALFPLPPSPEDGFRTGLSMHPEVIDANLPADVDTDPPPWQE